MRRRDFQDLARSRIREGHILLQAAAYDGAYYLLGLAVESALKACIARKTLRHEFPDRKIVERSYSHNLVQLASVAGLDQIIEIASETNPRFAANWNIVKDWTIDSRYETHDDRMASDLYRAITGRRDGVMACIRRHW